MTAVIRPVVPGDAAALSALYRAQRDFLAPFEPVRAESFFTEVTQRVRLTEIAERRRMGAGYSWLILDEGVVAGHDLALERHPRPVPVGQHRLLRGPRAQRPRPGHLGGASRWWKRPSRRWACTVSRPARCSTTPAPSGVLTKAGFEQFGLARRYLHIGGEWRDHVLFQRLSDT